MGADTSTCRLTATLDRPLPEPVQQNLKRGYLNAVSFLDRKVGELLDGLDRLGVSNSTIIIVHGDHGYHLGEQGLWAKVTMTASFYYTNFSP